MRACFTELLVHQNVSFLNHVFNAPDYECSKWIILDIFLNNSIANLNYLFVVKCCCINLFLVNKVKGKKLWYV